MTISRMTIEDYNEVYSLWLSTKGMGLNTLDDSREGIQRYLNRNPTTCFIAKDMNQVIGIILAGHDGRRGFIYHLAVKQEQRKKGIGRALVDRAEEALREEGINKAALVVFDKNEVGNGFWENIGYIIRNDLVYRNRVLAEKEMKRMDI